MNYCDQSMLIFFTPKSNPDYINRLIDSVIELMHWLHLKN